MHCYAFFDKHDREAHLFIDDTLSLLSYGIASLDVIPFVYFLHYLQNV
jgi:hypothetical protein